MELPPPGKTRAVRRDLKPRPPGQEYPVCPGCGKEIKWFAPTAANAPGYSHLTGCQVICNVYAKEKWECTEHFHETCYLEAGSPHGEMITGHEQPRNARNMGAT